MVTEIRSKIIRIAEHFGYQNQKLKLIEEMSELTQALLKDTNVEEELADVRLMLLQIIELRKSGDTVSGIMVQKINRTITRYNIT